MFLNRVNMRGCKFISKKIKLLQKSLHLQYSNSCEI